MPGAREAHDGCEAESEETKHGEESYQNAGGDDKAMLLISKAAGVLANHNGSEKVTHPGTPNAVISICMSFLVGTTRRHVIRCS